MNGDHGANTNGSRGPWPKRAGARAEPGDLIQGLERLRETLRDRLDQLERLVQDRIDEAPVTVPTEATASARERALQEKINELEERQARLVVDARRREHEWQTSFEQLENDRKLLTEAWDRLERERIDGAPATTHAPRRGAAAVVPAPAPVVIADPVPVAAASAEANDAIAHAILKQFETLRGDVRRNGTRRRPRA